MLGEFQLSKCFSKITKDVKFLRRLWFQAQIFQLRVSNFRYSDLSLFQNGQQQRAGRARRSFFSLNFISHLKTVKYPKESPDILFWRIGGTRKIVYTQISIRYSLKYFHLNSGPESDQSGQFSFQLSSLTEINKYLRLLRVTQSIDKCSFKMAKF